MMLQKPIRLLIVDHLFGLGVPEQLSTKRVRDVSEVSGCDGSVPDLGRRNACFT